MAFLNRATLIGNIGKDPEIKTLQNGRKFVSFSLATSKRYRDNNGEQKEETQWHNIVIWGKTAETFATAQATVEHTAQTSRRDRNSHTIRATRKIWTSPFR